MSGSDDDLFAEQTEEEKREEEELEKMRKDRQAKIESKVNKQRSLILVEVMPDSPETDLEKIVEIVHKTELEGLTWGENTKTEPFAFGLKKLLIPLTIFDHLVDGNMIEDIFEQEALADMISSHKIASWNKL